MPMSYNYQTQRPDGAETLTVLCDTWSGDTSMVTTEYYMWFTQRHSYDLW